MKLRSSMATVAASLMLALAGTAAHAVSATGVTTITITSNVNSWLQVAEVQARDLFDSLLTFSSATASTPASGFGQPPTKAIDGSTGGAYFQIYHSSQEFGESLTLTFDSAKNLSKLTVFGRTDCPVCDSRDVYLVNWNGPTAGSTVLDAANSSHQASIVFATPVPEPSELAMLLGGLGIMGMIARRRKVQVQ